ncbi:MAG: hypothetical protein L0956_01765, partial [Candidatus Mariimomonas ferrooxydans]
MLPRSTTTPIFSSLSFFKNLSCPSTVILTVSGLSTTSSSTGIFFNSTGISIIITECPFRTTKNQSRIAKTKEASFSHGFVVINLLNLSFPMSPHYLNHHS